jgi:hypothetical protein
MKSFKRSLVLALAVFMLGVLAAAAAAPNVRPDPGGTAVDGNASEWQVSPLSASNPDWFSVTCTGGGGGGTSCPGAERGDVFLRYNCTSHTLFVLMLADRGFAYQIDPVNNWIAVGGISNKVVRDAAPYTTNAAPPMWRDLTNGTGAEAGIDKDQNGVNLAPGQTYSMNFHTENGGATSGTNDVQVTLPSCTPTAVTVSTMSAASSDGSLNLALVALGGAGLVVLGGLVFVAARKR